MTIDDILYDLLNNAVVIDYSKPATIQHAPVSKPCGRWCPDIQRVTFNDNTTIVFFVDGTYAIVKCSAGDKYDRKTAIVYAMVKRLLGKVGKLDPKTQKFHPNEIDGAGFGSKLQEIVDKGFDQQREEKLAQEKKLVAKQEHEARQAAQKQAAFEKKVEARAKQILLERAAIDRANEIEDTNMLNAIETPSKKSKTCTCKKSCICTESKSKTDDILKTYVKPAKPFSEFTASEKREYWRYHNAKKRANNM